MSASLSVIVPNTIGSAQITSSNVPENDYPVWTAGATFASGAFCISTVTHRVYQSMKDANTGHDPTNILNQSSPTIWWFDYGPTNRMAMFDGDVSTQTAITSPLTAVLKTGIFNSIYLAGLDADDVSIVVKDAPGGNVIFSLDVPLEGSAPGDYDEYFWDPFKPLTDLVVSGIDQYGAAELTINISKGSGIVKCGVMTVGDLRDLGQTLYGVEVKPKTYAYIDTDKFGVTKIVRRKATTDLSLTAFVKPEDADTIVDIIQSVLDVPCIWIGCNLPGYRAMRVFGLGSGVMKYPTFGQCQLSLSVMGVISTSSQ